MLRRCDIIRRSWSNLTIGRLQQRQQQQTLLSKPTKLTISTAKSAHVAPTNASTGITSFFHKILKISLGTSAVTGAGVLLTILAAEQDKRNATPDGLPLEYDVDVIDRYWSGHKAMVLQRQLQILVAVLPFIAKSFLEWDILTLLTPSDSHSSSVDNINARQDSHRVEDSATAVEEKLARQRAWACTLCDLLISLGPAFIKLGQILSIRPDLLPDSVLSELQKLCDAVPPYPTPLALKMIEEELGAPASSVFSGLDAASEPIAAASLGQVYRCRLKAAPRPSAPAPKGWLASLFGSDDNNNCSNSNSYMTTSSRNGDAGEVEVAVKVQRPDMLMSVSLDIYITRQYVRLIESFKALLLLLGVGAPRKQFDLDLLDSYARGTYFELDYEHEATNQEFFRQQFHQRGLRQVHVPAVHRQATSRRVLTSEWIQGVPLAKSSPQTIAKLVPVGVECFLTQMLEMGVFHGDPHPGNLLVNAHNQLVIIDFGLCADISSPNSSALTSAIVHLMRSDVPALLEDAIILGFLPDDVDKTDLIPAMEEVFAKGKEARAGALSRHKYQSSVRRQQFRTISSNLNSVFYKYPFVVPEYFALLTKSLILLEGIAATGDSDFDIFAASYPYASRKALQQLSGRGV